MVNIKVKKKKPVALKHSEVVLDWKDQIDLGDLQEALEHFGIVVTEHPGCVGTDSYGFIFSNRPLTDKEHAEAATAF